MLEIKWNDYKLKNRRFEKKTGKAEMYTYLKGNLPATAHLWSTWLSSPPWSAPLANTSQIPSPSSECFRGTIPPLWCLSALLNNFLVRNFCSRSLFVRSELRLRSLWYWWQFIFFVLKIRDGKLILSRSSELKKLQDETSRSKFTSATSVSCSSLRSPRALSPDL